MNSLLQRHRSSRTSIHVTALLTGCMLGTMSFAEDLEHEDSSAKYQITYNQQAHPSFKNGVTSNPVNTLGASADKMYTFSTTAHWGMRTWSGGEVYFNPEIASGVPFSSNLVGLGGFTNGEITRAAGTVPTLYRQRLFLRQTWNQGGGTQQVESDFNQMAGSVDKNRFVLTAGNFSTLDVFDDNAYAKDPRTQFMNWGNWTYSSFDYAADARGFGWGFAGEWYQGDWVLRLGRMTGPKEPNGLAVDFQIGKHYGDQVEIEHAHMMGEHPGKIRVLAWRNKANVASFNDASSYYALNQNKAGFNPQTILQVRNGDKIKYGLGINLEQEIDPTLGFFMRAMKTDGRTETYAFTEADDSFSSGFLIKGERWGRGEDTLGVSWMRNFLSKDRRNYLAKGGISFFIGDGSLDYQPEDIFEGFYSFGLYKNTWLTADYQYINHPAYNASRGPVNVYALRLHAEF